MTARRTLACLSTLAVVCLVVLGPTARAATPLDTAAGTQFYVSPHGQDAAAGTSPQHPFEHVQQCADVLGPGDTCVLMSGTYREAVRPARSGTAQHPITYRPFHDARVTVSGADPVDGWRKVSLTDLADLAAADPFLTQSPFADAVQAQQIYQTHVPVNADLPGTSVFVDGGQLVQAQWPYPGADPLTPTVQRAKEGTTDTTVVDPALGQPAGYWAGAKLYTTYWFVSETNDVASSAPGSVTIAGDPSLVGMVPDKTRYYLFGTLKVLSHPGEWFYAEDTQTLYLWPTDGDSPGKHQVELQQRRYAFDLDGVSNTRLENLDLTAASVRTGDTSTGVVLDRLHASYVESYWDDIEWYGEQDNTGIIVRGHDNVLTNSVIAHSAGNGVVVLGQDNVVSNNVIHDVDAMGVYAAGVTVQGQGQLISHNTISRVGRAGINVPVVVDGPRMFRDNSISYNDLSEFARLNTDAGAFYSCCEHDMTGTSIDHNWVHDATPMPGSSLFGPEAGIYVDNGDYNAVVHSNVGWNVEAAVVKVNQNGTTPPTGNKVYDNDAYAQDTAVQLINMPDATGTEVVNNIGDVTFGNVDQANLRLSNNLPAGVDPRLVRPSGCDFGLRADSPARNAGAEIPGVTDGHTDPNASIGAYQYGLQSWRAGSTLARPSCPHAG